MEQIPCKQFYVSLSWLSTVHSQRRRSVQGEFTQMKGIAIRRCLGLSALFALAFGLFVHNAEATTIGVIPAGSSYSDTISSSGPTFTQDYTFSLDSSATHVSILATALGQTSSTLGVDLLKIALYDSAHNLIASASGAPVASFDSLAQSGIGLTAGDYLFTIFGAVTAGKDAFVSISLAANNIAVAPIPAAGLMLLTGLGALGGAAWRRRKNGPVAAA